MYCLKCGKETADEKVFCQDCIASMDAYPVKPGTAIHLPKRQTSTAPKKAARRTVSPEDQICHLKRVNRWLSLFLVLCVILLGVASYLLITDALAPPPADPNIIYMD